MSNNGTLYIIATPIGNLNEVSFRTIDTLKNVKLIACEDTRNTRKLLSKFGIHNDLFSYHNYNEKESYVKLLSMLLEGNDIAIVSDAGYPLISDPGYEIVAKAIEHNININVVSGPNAALNALVGSGLDTNHYFFYGFLNAKPSQAKKELIELKELPYTMIFYEAPHRINKTLGLMIEVLGNRKVSIARELTKLHEEYLRGYLSDFVDKEFKGEIVIVVEGNKEIVKYSDEELLKFMDLLVNKGYKTKEAAQEIANENGVSKNYIYNLYLRRKNDL